MLIVNIIKLFLSGVLVYIKNPSKIFVYKNAKNQKVHFLTCFMPLNRFFLHF
jgi:hypothetical protein